MNDNELQARLQELEEEVECWKLKWIEATNPGIDMDQVKIGREAHKRALELGAMDSSEE